MSYGSLQYGDGLLILVDKLEVNGGKILLSGTTYDHEDIPKGDTVFWTWRGPDNKVIFRYRSPNIFRGITVGKGCSLTINQPIEINMS